MPAVITLKKREDGGPVKWRHRAGFEATQDDPDVYVDDVERAEELCEQGPFLLKAEGLGEIDAEAPDLLPDDVDVDADEEEDQPPDSGEVDVAALLEGTVDEVADALASGRYDGHLGRVDQQESAGMDRKGVHEAVDDRRAEVEEEDADEDASADEEDGSNIDEAEEE